MTTRQNEIKFLQSRNIDIDWEDLDEAEYFIHYLYARLLEIAENEDGLYTKAAAKKCKMLKKAIAHPLMLKAAGQGFYKMLKNAGHKL